MTRNYPAHEDLGLIEDDRTPDLRPGKDDDPGAGTPSETNNSEVRKVSTR